MPRISLLPVAGAIVGTELTVCVQGGVTKQTTVNDLVAGSPLGGPHWNTPAAGQLQWNAVNSPANSCIRLDDTGFTFQKYNAGSAVHWQDALGVDSVIEAFGGGVFSVLVTNGYVYNITIVAGGQVSWNPTGNVFTVAGFTTCTYQLTNQTPGFWGGPGVPTTVEAAIDRIANVVSAGGGTPIP